MEGGFPPEMNMLEPIINVLIFLDNAPEVKTVADVFEEHIWPQYRFCSVVKDGFFEPREGMDRTYHFKKITVADEAAIDAHVQTVMFQSLDREQPMWTVSILQAQQGRSAVLVRIHHVISDGLGLLFAFLPTLGSDHEDILSKIPLPSALLGRSGRSAELPDEKKVARTKSTTGCLSRILSGIKMFFRAALSIIVVKADSELKINPVLSGRTPFVPFNGNRIYTRLPPVSMRIVKAVREKHGGTVNDVIMAALVGALRNYSLQDLGDSRLQGGQAIECKAFMMVGLPRPVDPNDPSVSLVNNVLFASVSLPIDVPTAEGRLQRVVESFGNMKSSAYVIGLSLTTRILAKLAPPALFRKAVSEAFSKHTCIVSSVPMPTVPFRWPGNKGGTVKEVQMVFPNCIPQISLISYNGFVYCSIVADPALIPDGGAFGKKWVSEFDALAAGAGA